jgi:ribonuclease HI
MLVLSHSPNPSIIKDLAVHFDVVCDPNPTLYLGLNVNRVNDGYVLSCERYITELAERFDRPSHSTISTPLVERTRPRGDDEEQADRTQYQSVIGALNWIASLVRADVCYAVSSLSRYAADPSVFHLQCALRLLDYLIATKSHGLVYRKPVSISDHRLSLFVDADYAGDSDRLSTGGYALLFGGCLVAYASKKIALIVTSSTEAELYAVHTAIEEAQYLRKVLASVGIRFPGPLLISEDNQAVIASVAGNSSSKLKQHDVVLKFVRQQVLLGNVAFKYVRSAENSADCLTKPLGRTQLSKLRAKLGIDST